MKQLEDTAKKSLVQPFRRAMHFKNLIIIFSSANVRFFASCWSWMMLSSCLFSPSLESQQTDLNSWRPLFKKFHRGNNLVRASFAAGRRIFYEALYNPYQPPVPFDSFTLCLGLFGQRAPMSRCFVGIPRHPFTYLLFCMSISLLNCQ